jgi:hypothetical protein
MLAAQAVRQGRYRWQVDNYIEDKVILKRGSYFAVRSSGDIQDSRRRVGEDDIIRDCKIIR